MTTDQIVYVVDDDHAVRESLAALLEAHDLSVEAFESGRDFLDVFDHKRVGCVLLDVRMPDISGLQILETLAARAIDLSVIMVSGHADIPMAVMAMKLGAFDFIEKPFADEALVTSVRNALVEGRKARVRETSNEGFLDRVSTLTPREREVFEHMILGRPNKVIAYEMDISPRTVEIHRARVMDKAQARSLSQLVRMAISAGVDPESA